MNEKITGYFLLGVGVFLILFSLVSVFLVFTGVTKPAQLFNSSGISFDLNSMVGNNLQALQNPRGNTNQQSKPTELVSASLINDSTNLFVHLLLMGFVASSGFKLATLGVQMLRPINVKLKASDGKEIPTEK